MADNELLQAISEMMDKKLDPIKNEIQDIKSDIQNIKSDIQTLQLHIENTTDRNLQILAENHLSLVEKLNQAIKVSDKSALFEIKVNYLTEKIEKLEHEIKDLKNKLAS